MFFYLSYYLAVPQGVYVFLKELADSLEAVSILQEVLYILVQLAVLPVRFIPLLPLHHLARGIWVAGLHIHVLK